MMEENALPFCAAGKHAFPPRAHATMHAHKQADAITTYAFLSQGYVLPLLGHTSSAVIPLLVFAVAVLWVSVSPSLLHLHIHYNDEGTIALLLCHVLNSSLPPRWR